MSTTAVNQLLTEAMKLTPDERAELVQRLSADLDGGPELHAGWEAEIARRVAEMAAGRTQFMPADEALGALSDHIQARRTAA